MKKATLLILILLMLIPNIVFAEEKPEDTEVIVKEYEFTSNDADFDYKPPNQITEDEKVYNLQGIEYKILSEKKLYTTVTELISQEIIEEGLAEKDGTLFAESMDIDDNGFIGSISLKEIIYTESIETDRVGSHTAKYSYGFQALPPNPASTLDVLVTDKRTKLDVLANLPLSEVKTGKTLWKDNFHALHICRSIYEDEYQLSDGVRLSFLADNPEHEGFSESILLDMRLSHDHYRIIDSEWIGDLSSSDGNYIRAAEYTIERKLTNYTAVYSGNFDLPDILTYTAAAVYEGELSKEIPDGIEYQVKAIATYQEQAKKKVPTAAIVGGSSGFIALCGLVFMLIKKKKKNEA